VFVVIDKDGEGIILNAGTNSVTVGCFDLPVGAPRRISDTSTLMTSGIPALKHHRVPMEQTLELQKHYPRTQYTMHQTLIFDRTIAYCLKHHPIQWNEYVRQFERGRLSAFVGGCVRRFDYA
jgi:hypothetical protein